MDPNNPNPNPSHSDNQNQNPSVDENNNDNPQEPNNESEEDENEYYDHLPADHPHLRRFQMSLEDQLKTEEEKIRLLYKEKSEDLIETLRNFKDTHNEMTVIIEEVMKI